MVCQESHDKEADPALDPELVAVIDRVFTGKDAKSLVQVNRTGFMKKQTWTRSFPTKLTEKAWAAALGGVEIEPGFYPQVDLQRWTYVTDSIRGTTIDGDTVSLSLSCYSMSGGNHPPFMSGNYVHTLNLLNPESVDPRLLAVLQASDPTAQDS